ncbi:helix-turn-helix transcriptional regulator [Labrenzia sp. PHM005]|uniref:helix-turn-helix domain-containing protein n=1 Tax=Labrenzia sp. PHM005 TaxID=2590016 RepID=UPI00114089C5|nr:helix-turn-helix transcriptional regulator [Labrenzia sp. PHM005]QDG74437.1 helix-turn-helix transcriptional regulator [Labrenzia sp. PHM005]
MSRQIPAHIETYVEVLGHDLAIEFFLRFGGTELYFGPSPKRSMILDLTGPEKLAMLSERLGGGYVNLPIPKKWIAQQLDLRGLSRADIARKLHVDQSTVRRWFSNLQNTNQLQLFS